MMELNPGLNAVPPNEAIAPPREASSRWRGPAIAVLLSLLFTGLGQWKNRQPWKGLALAAIFPVLILFAGYSRTLLSFKGMIAFLSIAFLLRGLICVDAFRGALRGREARKSFQQATVVYVISGALILTCGIIPSTNYFLRRSGQAFKVPSTSMCPTICEGERIVADMDAFLKNAPQRGDIIIFEFHSAHGPLFIKRVIGVAGDVISESDGAILVNGKPPMEPSQSQICGKLKDDYSMGGELPRFNPLLVPASSFFVVGDNSPHSYDSRFPGFGLATSDQIKGRPLYIYWSKSTSRIGCAIK
jgi:signal peptidase I